MRGRLVVAVLIGIVAVLLLQQYTGTPGVPSPQASTPSASAPSTISGVPPEAIGTIALIQSDGPFPYRQDGAVFQNRERRLPIRDPGYWREYTVPTPGESDRGARRIVHGQRDEYYYTDDHYGSFRLIDVPDLARR